MTIHSATPGYFTRYENFAFERTDDGVLTLRFHTKGGPITFTGQTHEDLPQALEEIALDQNSRALLLTGTGDTFMASIEMPYRFVCKDGEETSGQRYETCMACADELTKQKNAPKLAKVVSRKKR